MEKTIDEIVEEKIVGDADFQESIKDMADDERNPLVEAKRKEILASEFKSLADKAKEAEEYKQKFADQQTRNKKLDEDLKKYKPSEKKDDNSLSTKDFYALTKANVPEEDVDEVAEFARFKGISVQDALKSPVMRSILSEKAEVRKTAQATNTRTTRAQNIRPDGSEIMQSIKSKGEDAVPEAGSEEAIALFKARAKATGKILPSDM